MSPQLIANYEHSIEAFCHSIDDVSSLHETVDRMSSAASMPQHPIYKRLSIYSAGMRGADAATELESVDAYSNSAKNMLATRDEYSLQVLIALIHSFSVYQ